MSADPVASRRYQSAKALLKDLKLLRLRMSLAAKTLGLPLHMWFLIGVMAALVAVSAFRVKSALVCSESRWKAQDEHVAQESERAKAEIASSLRGINDSLMNDANENLASLEKEIAEIVQRIAAEEKLLAETDWKGDFSAKARMGNGIRDERNYLTNYLLRAKASEIERIENLKARRKAK